MNKKFCIHCGRKIKEQDQVCPFCHYNQQTNHLDQPNQASQASQFQQTVHTNQTNPNQQNQGRVVRNVDNQGYTSTNSNPSQPQYSTIIKRKITPPKRSFSDAFKLFWKNYANFSGYSTRAEFWWWFLIEYIINAVLMMIEMSSIESAFANDGSFGSSLSGLILLIIWWLIVLIPNLSLRTRRFRDAGVSTGWTVAILIIDYVPAIIPILGMFIVFCCRIATIVIECMSSRRTVVQR